MAYDKAVDSAVLDAGLTSVADAIRQKGGTSASLAFPQGFVDAIGNISGGGEDTISALLDNTLTELTYTGTGAVPRNLARDKTAITSISMPNVTEVGAEAFYGCTGVGTYNFQSLVSAGAMAFQHFGKGALSALHLPSLTTASGNYTFGYMGTNARHVTIVLPAIVTLGTDAFRGGTGAGAYDAIDLGPDLTQLANRTFYNPIIPYTVVILRRSDAVIPLTSSNAVDSLTAACTVYIPKALYDHLGDGGALDYKSATNWTSAAALVQWACIEGSQYENAYADGTPIV